MEVIPDGLACFVLHVGEKQSRVYTNVLASLGSLVSTLVISLPSGELVAA